MLEAIRKIMVLAAAVVMPFLCAAPAAHASSVRPIRSVQAGGSEVVSQPNGSAVSTQKAKKVNLSVYSVLQSTDYSPILDDNEWTYKTMSRNITLHIYGDKAFSSLYLKFELPNEWMVTLPDGTGLEGGKNEFIHEWLPLGQSVKNVDLSLAKNTKLTDIYAFTDGELPSWVQVWQPPCENADLMVMPTHSDDEHLWFGGAMPYYAGELGYKVQVVYMTNHRQYTIRCHEQLNGLWAVGVTHYPIISDTFRDVPATGRYDKAAEIFGYDNVLGFQVEMLRRFRPKVIIAHDINGEYGHTEPVRCRRCICICGRSIPLSWIGAKWNSAGLAEKPRWIWPKRDLPVMSPSRGITAWRKTDPMIAVSSVLPIRQWAGIRRIRMICLSMWYGLRGVRMRKTSRPGLSRFPRRMALYQRQIPRLPPLTDRWRG